MADDSEAEARIVKVKRRLMRLVYNIFTLFSVSSCCIVKQSERNNGGAFI
jgi:hypothetical protein